MSARSTKGDDKGFERGARGIDGRDGEDFHTERYSAKPIQGIVAGEHGAACAGQGRSGGAMLKSAKGK